MWDGGGWGLVRGERRRCRLPTTDQSADPCNHTQNLADLYNNWKAWIRTKDLAREASPAIHSYLKAEFAKLRNSGILTISEVKLGVLTTFLAQFGVMLRSVATSSCITNGFVRAGLCSRVAGVAVAGPNIEKMLMREPEKVRPRITEEIALARIAPITTPIFVQGRDRDELQGIFRVCYDLLHETGKATRWESYDHDEHGFIYVARDVDGAYRPDAIQRKVVADSIMFFREHMG